MNLEDFVSSSIIEIVSGIKKAHDRLGPQKIVAINPIWPNLGLNEKNVQTLTFDIAITAAETKQSGVGAGASVGIQVVSANVGGKKDKIIENSSVSRVTFSLPFIPSSTTVIP